MRDVAGAGLEPTPVFGKFWTLLPATEMNFSHLRVRARRFVLSVAAVLATSLAFGTTAHGHDVPRSEARVTVQGAVVHVDLRLNLLEMPGIDLNGDGSISYDELDHSIDRIYSTVKQHYVLAEPEAPIQVVLERDAIVEAHVVDMQLLYTFPHDVEKLQITSTLDQVLQRGHEHLVTLVGNGATQEAVLDAATPMAQFSIGSTSYLRTVKNFVQLGITHIFTGYDHLSFLLGLLIVTTSIGALVRIVTSFTLAHSITLALATFNIIVLPSRLTESLIALSIAYVALENLLGLRAIERHRVTFLFGLAHGFGFSNVLREMQLSRSHLALSLFSFNAGVEIGQLAFVLLLFPAVLYVGRLGWQRHARLSVSMVVMCLAMYWFVRRAFLV